MSSNLNSKEVSRGDPSGKARAPAGLLIQMCRTLAERLIRRKLARWSGSMALVSAEHRLTWLPWGLLVRAPQCEPRDLGGGYWIFRCETSTARARYAGLHSYAWKEYLREALAAYGIGVVLDAGANLGQYGELLRSEIGFRGRIVSFEPLPGAHQELASKASEDSHWEAHQCALGSEDGELELNESVGSDFSSFRETNSEATRIFGDRVQMAQRHRVSVRTLGGLWQELGLPTEAGVGDRILLKMDTQGWDIEVMKGLGAAMSSVTLIQTEVAAAPLYEGAADLPETVRYLNDRGFDLLYLSPLSIDHGLLQVLEYDAVFVNRHQARRLVQPQ
ncbi:MAG: hypothetical protein CFE40_02165 [Burkholderiales bacterium PBB1]|nr:MAG: hypothetical protein CFE40_02165 [Burkholderiales bacterium PBB1]